MCLKNAFYKIFQTRSKFYGTAITHSSPSFLAFPFQKSYKTFISWHLHTFVTHLFKPLYYHYLYFYLIITISHFV